MTLYKIELKKQINIIPRINTDETQIYKISVNLCKLVLISFLLNSQ